MYTYVVNGVIFYSDVPRDDLTPCPPRPDPSMVWGGTDWVAPPPPPDCFGALQWMQVNVDPTTYSAIITSPMGSVMVQDLGAGRTDRLETCYQGLTKTPPTNVTAAALTNIATAFQQQFHLPVTP